MPSPQQQSLFDNDAYRAAPAPSRSLNPAGKLFDTTPYDKPAAASRPSQAEHVRSVHGGEQLKMFMTPKEIHSGWQPLDADRQESGDGYGGTYEGTYTPKSWDTGETHPGNVNSVGTHTYEVAERRYPGIQSGPGGNDTGTIRRTRGGGKYRLHGRGNDVSEYESDDELWDRKLEETKEFPKGGQHDYYGSPDPLAAAHKSGDTMGTYEGQPTVRPGARMASSGAWERHYEREQSHEDRRMAQDDAKHGRGADSMYDSIREQGVLGPIRLGRQEGSQGKPQIVGGHHRLAAATDIDENKLVPVLHDENIWDAQYPPKGGYPYA